MGSKTQIVVVTVDEHKLVRAAQRKIGPTDSSYFRNGVSASVDSAVFKQPVDITSGYIMQSIQAICWPSEQVRHYWRRSGDTHSYKGAIKFGCPT